jgi:hypothetical protein
MLELTLEHIEKLNDEQLRLLVVKLCEAELRAGGHPESSVHSGGNQTAKDGGTDVRVSLPAGTTDGLDFIPRASTIFQVKCENMPPSKIGGEMRPGGKLRSSIKELMAHDGAYVIVASQGTTSDLFLNKRKEEMRKAVARHKDASRLLLDFYDSDRLARWARKYTGVELWVRDRVGARLQGWHPYGPWAGEKSEAPYLKDPVARLETRSSDGRHKVSIADGADLLREKLRKPGGLARLIGLSGTGKTRLVQALFEPGLGSSQPLDHALALYTDIGQPQEPAVSEMLVALGAREQRAIVVVDNCNPMTHAHLAEVASKFGNCLSLITIEYDVVDDDVEKGELFELSPASDRVLQDILQRGAPHLVDADLHFITSISGGNARIALALARTVQKGESLGALNDTVVFRRLFRQGQADDPALERAAEAASLVYSFDVESTGETSELHLLARLAAMAPEEFFRHVETLRSRDLVQARGEWRALLPPALASRLAKQALRTRQRAAVLEVMTSQTRLMLSFARRLEHLEGSEEARGIAKAWLLDASRLGNFESLDEDGRLLLRRIAPLAQEEVLAMLERCVSDDGMQPFLAAQKGSLSDWSGLARSLAFAAALLERAATVLLRLAESQTDGTLECRNAFRELFWIGLSGTLAPVEQRTRFLRKVLARGNPAHQELARDGAAAMLDTIHISTSHDFGFGARANAYGWQPTTDGDELNWLQHALALAQDVVKSGPEGLQSVRQSLELNFLDLWRYEGLRSTLEALMKQAATGGWPGGWVAARKSLSMDGRHMPDDVRSKLQALANSLAPAGLVEEVLAYAAGSGTTADIADALDDSDDGQNRLNAWEQAFEKATDLGRQAAASPEALLLQVLPHVHCSTSNRSHAFGEGLGSATTQPKEHWKLLTRTYEEAGPHRNLGLLRGYLRGVRRSDQALAAKFLDAAIDSSVYAQDFGRLLDAPADDAEGDLILKALTKGVARASTFTLRTAGSFGPWGLSVAKFCEVADALSRSDGGLVPMLDELAADFYGWKTKQAPLPPEQLALGRSFLERYDFQATNNNTYTRVDEVAKHCLQGPVGEPAARALASKLAPAIEKYRIHVHHYGELLRTLFKHQPRVTLDCLLANASAARQRALRYRPSRKGPFLEFAPVEDVMKWVAEAPEVRALTIAPHVPFLDKADAHKKSSLANTDKSPVRLSELASKLLAVAPNKRAVLDVIAQNFDAVDVSNMLSTTMEPYSSALEGLSKSEDPIVAAWATETNTLLANRAKAERVVESLEEKRFE